MNQTMGMIHTLSVPSAPNFEGHSSGPLGPPRNSVTVTADIVMMFMNSARKKIAKRMPEYSVTKPPTSSCSASTRSNGGGVLSSRAAMTKITNGISTGGIRNQCRHSELSPVQLCWSTISPVDRVPAWMSAARIPRPNAASYDNIWADARTDPSNGYFEPLDHPASITPYTAMPEHASTHMAPNGSSATWSRVS